MLCAVGALAVHCRQVLSSDGHLQLQRQVGNDIYRRCCWEMIILTAERLPITNSLVRPSLALAWNALCSGSCPLSSGLVIRRTSLTSTSHVAVSSTYCVITWWQTQLLDRYIEGYFRLFAFPLVVSDAHFNALLSLLFLSLSSLEMLVQE